MRIQNEERQSHDGKHKNAENRSPRGCPPLLEAVEENMTKKLHMMRVAETQLLVSEKLLMGGDVERRWTHGGKMAMEDDGNTSKEKDVMISSGGSRGLSSNSSNCSLLDCDKDGLPQVTGLCSLCWLVVSLKEELNEQRRRQSWGEIRLAGCDFVVADLWC